jgi:hypothetical protein
MMTLVLMLAGLSLHAHFRSLRRTQWRKQGVIATEGT